MKYPCDNVSRRLIEEIQVNNQIDDYMCDGIIEISISEYDSPMKHVGKKNGDYNAIIQIIGI